jgi:chemotaxis protein methyltransferase CheR
VLCRHLLGHLLDESRGRVLANLEGALAPGGWLVLGANETAPALAPASDRPGFHRRPTEARAAA